MHCEGFTTWPNMIYGIYRPRSPSICQAWNRDLVQVVGVRLADNLACRQWWHGDLFARVTNQHAGNMPNFHLYQRSFNEKNLRMSFLLGADARLLGLSVFSLVATYDIITLHFTTQQSTTYYQ